MKSTGRSTARAVGPGRRTEWKDFLLFMLLVVSVLVLIQVLLILTMTKVGKGAGSQTRLPIERVLRSSSFPGQASDRMGRDLRVA